MDTGCNTTQHFYDYTSTTSPPFTVPGSNNALTNSSLGSITRPYPYGRYWICASVAKTGGTGTDGTYSVATTQTGFVSNTAFGGVTAPVLTINTSTGSPTTCATRWAAITALAAP